MYSIVIQFRSIKRRRGEEMDYTQGRRFIVKAVCLMSVCLSAWLANAESPLGPMAGTGGVMRDAERRALSTEKPEKTGEVPEIEPGKSDSALSDDKKAAILGEVASVTVHGSVEFAERMDIATRLMAELGEGVKTAGEVEAALAKIRQEFMKEGYYLFRISPFRKKFYDAETKNLSVLVDQGSIGKLTVSFDGEDEGTWFSRRQIERRFKNLKEGDAFDYKVLRSALFDANSHPDLVIDTSIDVRKPIEGEGDDRRISRYADMSFNVHESMPFHMLWEVNNYGMEEIEEWQTTLTAQYLNLFKQDDVLTFSPSMSFGAEMISFAGSYMLPHHYWLGGNTTLYGGYSDLDVDDIVSRLNLDGSGWFFGLQHSENIYDTDSHLLAVSGGLLWRSIEDQYTAMGYALNERSTTIMPLSLALSYTGKKTDGFGGRNFATIQGLLNFVNTGDSLDELWSGAEEDYWLVRWQLARLQSLFGWFDESAGKDLHQWMLFLKLEGQYSTDTLIPVEKLALGGYNCMRGYRTRGYLGDYGVYGTVELRTPILVDPISALFSDRTDKKPIDRLQFLGFVDYGWTAFNDLPSSYDDSEFLYSAGLGTRFSLTKYLQLKCDVAFPLHDTDWADDDSMEVYLSIQAQF